MVSYLLAPFHKLGRSIIAVVDYLLCRDQRSAINANLSSLVELLDDLNLQFHCYRQSQPGFSSATDEAVFRGGNLPSITSEDKVEDLPDKDQPAIFMQTDDDLYELERMEEEKLKRGGVVTLEDDLEDHDIGG